MTSMIALIVWSIAGILVAVYQLKKANGGKLPSFMFWLTYAVLMLNLVENAVINAH